MKELLLKIKKYMEDAEVAIDGDWGSCRSLEELLEDGEMSKLYYEVLDELKRYE